MIRAGHLLPLLLLLFAVGGEAAGGEDAGEAAPSRLVIEAVRTGDEEALRAVAARVGDEVWNLVDELCSEGRSKEVDALLRVAQVADLDALRRYGARRCGKPVPEGGRRAIAEALEASRDGRHESALLLVESLRPEVETVLEVLAAEARGAVLAAAIRHGEAAEAFTEAANSAERIGWRTRAAWLWTRAGNAANDDHDHTTALDHRTRAYNLFRALGDAEEALDTLHDMAGERAEQRAYRAALAEFERVLHATGDPAARAQVHGNLSLMHQCLGNLREALHHAEEGERLLPDGAGPGDRAAALGRRAIVLLDLGRADEALAAQESVVGILEGAAADAPPSSDLRLDLALAEGNLAAVFVDLGKATEGKARADRLAAAERSLRRALAIFEKEFRDEHWVALGLAGLGEILGLKGDLAGALVTFDAAVRRSEEEGDSQAAASTMAQKAEALHRAGRYSEALETYSAARALARRIEARDAELEMLGGVARAHLALGSHAPALEAAREAAEILRGSVAGLAQGEGADARARRAEIFETGALAACESGDAAACLELLEAGRAGALLDAFGSYDALRAAVVPEDLARAERRAREEEEIAGGRLRALPDSADRKTAAARAKALEAARKRLRDAHARIHREALAAAQVAFPIPDPLEVIQGRLEAGQVFVAYGLFTETALAVVVTGDGARIVPLPAGADAIRDLVARLLPSRSPHVESEHLDALREAIWTPLALGEDARQVLVSPHDDLTYLPFALLAGDLEVAYVPSATVHGVLLKDAALRGEKVLALGDPVYERGTDPLAAEIYRAPEGVPRATEPSGARGGMRLARLPATGDEARAVGDIVLVRERATLPELRKELAKRKRWRAVHLACHGLANATDPDFSSLALTKAPDDDGFLTALEAFGTRFPADLVVLSACESARGKVVRGEGLRGLVQAFMVAGAPRVLATLWRVEDAPAAAFATKFHSLWKGRVAAAAALRETQDWMRTQTEKGWDHPRHWAPWVLWGLPN